VYRQRREAAAVPLFSNFVDTIYQQSSNSGQTFSAELKVNSKPSDVRFAAISDGTYEINCGGKPCSFLGDYFGISSSGDRTYVARSEAHPVSSSEPATFPPTVYHQRNWVTVLKTPATVPAAGLTGATPNAAAGQTGSSPAIALALAAGLTLLVGARLRARVSDLQRT
jgi:hypothetical protein